MRVCAAALICLLALTGCASDRATPGTAAERPTTTTAPPVPSTTAATTRIVSPGKVPPPLTLRTEAGELETQPGSYCWTSGDSGRCADVVMTDPDDLPVVEDATSVGLVFPLEGWTFSASFRPVDAGRCARTFDVVAEPAGPAEHHLDAAGPAGDYVVSVFGVGPQGDYGASFRWRTTRAGVLPAPTASIGIVWSPHGEIEGDHGLTLAVTGLDRTPESATATVTATAADGRSVSVDAGKPELGCPLEGTVLWSESDYVRSRQVAALGPPPFTYDVTLVLDGVEHRASATWPDDHVDDPFNDDPAPVPLELSPPLRGG